MPLTTEVPARSRSQRLADALHRLDSDVDAWVATTGESGGNPHLVPLSFLRDSATVLIAIPGSGLTARILKETGRTLIAIGTTRDVVLIDGSVEELSLTDIPDDAGEAFAVKTGFDPRRADNYIYFRVRPTRIQAWREENELADRVLMRDGAWLA